MQLPYITALIIVLALFLCSFAIINFKCFPKFCTSDMYEDTAYSMLTWKAKTIFPTDWVFGNQFYVVATPVICAAFYGITGNINLSMALATTVMTLLVILCMLYLIYPFTDKVGCLAGITAMVGCMTTVCAVMSLEGQLFYIFASYYSCYLITILLVLGDYLHALCIKEKRGFRSSFVLSMLLCFFTGMQSLRQTAILILPILIFESLRVVYLQCKKEVYVTKGSRAATIRAISYAASNMLGIRFMRLLNVPNIKIYGDLRLRNSSELKTAQETNMRILGKITGFHYTFTEKDGWIFFVLATFFTGIVIAAAFISLLGYVSERRKGENGKEYLFGLVNFGVFSICLIELFVLNIVFDINFRTTYMFVWYPFTAISCIVLLRYLKPKLPRKIGILLLCAGLIGNWFVGYSSTVQNVFKPHSPDVYEKISDFIVDEGYAYIYGEWSVICPIAVYTNGKALAASSCGNNLEILEYINPQGVYSEADNKKAVYVFCDHQNAIALQYAKTIGANLTLVAKFDDGKYTLYVSDRQLMHYSR